MSLVSGLLGQFYPGTFMFSVQKCRALHYVQSVVVGLQWSVLMDILTFI